MKTAESVQRADLAERLPAPEVRQLAMFVAMIGGAGILVFAQGLHPLLLLVVQLELRDAAPYVHGFT
jgi:hypothetical protein